MIGLFQENGPCFVNADGKTTKLNPYSWNSISNSMSKHNFCASAGTIIGTLSDLH
jgi:hypothetical protein